MNILVLDNYDSFTFNLVQYIQEIVGHAVDVFRNDAIDLDAVVHYDVIVLSPGPGLPKESGIMPALIKRYASEKAILGVCLGHQAIGEAFGAQLENLAQVYHGLETQMNRVDDGDPIYDGIPEVFQAGRYHSWVIKKDTLPSAFELTSMDEQGQIMSIRHRDYRVWGLQYHPESVMTAEGKQILRNFFERCIELPS